MVLAYDYPILGIFWTMLILFIWIAWIILLFRVFIDIFRSHDIGGVAKAIWAIFVLFLPFIGVFVYLIARGHHMAERDMQEAEKSEAAFRSYVQDVAKDSPSTAEEISKLAELNASGVLSDAEFQAQKAKLLG